MQIKRKRVKPDEMTLVEHLAELRSRLIVSVISVTAVAVVGYFIYPDILALLMHPLCEVQGSRDCGLYVTGPFDGFSVRLKISGLFGLFGALPVVLWELWRFIAPGLKSAEKRYGLGFVISSLVLFALGSIVAYEVFPFALRFFKNAAGANVHAIYTPQSYLNFLMLLMVAFGVAFLFPVVLVALQLLKIVEPATLSKKRRFAWFAIIIVVAVLIPSNDPYSLTAMTVPLLIFYELSILIGKLLIGRRAKRALADNSSSA